MVTERIARKTFGRLIYYKRFERGYSSKDLAKKLGISPASMSRFERGERDLTLNLMRKLRQADIDITNEIRTYVESGGLPDILS